MSFDALDDFAGPGGWDEGARMIGLRTLGIEWDMAACQTAKAAGHARIRADVAGYPSAPFAGISGRISSPPCALFSTAGKGTGRDALGGTAPTVPRPVDGPSTTLTGGALGQWVIRMGNQANSAVRAQDEPAPTVLFGHRSNKVEWFQQRPATTVVGSFHPEIISPPGYRTETSRQDADDGVKVTVAEGGVLQSFPSDYPWQGSRTKQYQQVGNAIPPRLAAHILGALTGVPDYQERIDAYYTLRWTSQRNGPEPDPDCANSRRPGSSRTL